MKNFVINLPHSVERRANVEKQLAKLNITPNFFDAVNGSLLTEQQLSQYIIESNYLSKGEIGCALSHLNIYKQMIENKIPYALIFEDDIVCTKNLNEQILTDIEQFIKTFPENSPCALLLYDSGFKSRPIQKLNDQYSINKTVNAFTTHAYVINLQAAKNILAMQQPIKFEIDAWKHYVYLHKLNLYNVVPSLIKQDEKISSIIEEQKERDFTTQQRKKQKKANFNLLFKKLPLKMKLKTYLFRLYKNVSFSSK